ncbi:carboxypeptidase regulatory-like domain-containing protein [Pendulispora rubella]|uniref:Carboxypeptidase regulatory-like domain-containing protein n=1 Tax=Pendulispora rubella TaxID=2741070 RepID=A0ABZ2LL38_9BACT
MNRRTWIALGVLAAALFAFAVYRFRHRGDVAASGERGDPAVSESTASEVTASDRDLPRGSVSGRVTDTATKPIAGAQVCAFASSDRLVSIDKRVPRCVTTGADGRYRIEDLLVASYEVTASATNYQPARWVNPEKTGRALTLASGEARENVDLVLTAGGVEVRGRVQDIGGGPVVGALVTVLSTEQAMFGPGGAANAVAQSDGKGEWQVWVAPGRIAAQVTAEGYADGSKDGIAPGQFIEISLTPESVLQGRVVEAGTDTPVAGARVAASGDSMGFGPGGGGEHTALTDAEGRFRIARLEPGRYKPDAKTPHRWGTARESVLLGVGETSGEVLIEAHPAATVSGRISFRDGKDGKGCAQGAVNLSEKGKSEFRWAKADDEGKVRVEGMLPGTYQVEVWCKDAALEEKYEPVTLADKDVDGLVWKVNGGLSLSGVVVDAKGAPVAGVTLFARTRGGDGRDPRSRTGWGNTESEKDGTFRIRGLLAGTYSVDVRREGIASPKEPTEVKVDRDVSGVRITLPAGGSIEGTVVDGSGAPVSAANVQAKGGTWGWNQTTTRDDGTFAIKGVNPGDYRVSASHGWSAMRAPGTKDDDVQGVSTAVKAGETARVKVIVESQRDEIRGRVVDDGGQPVTDAFVDAERESDSASKAQGQAGRAMRWAWGRRTPVLTELDGRFTLTKLSPGTYTVRAFRKGGGETISEKIRTGTEVTLTIRRTGSISGTVVGSKGASPERFSVTLRDEKTGVSRDESFFRTGGSFVLRDLPAGDFILSAEAPDGRAQTKVQLEQGAKREGLRLELEGNASLRGRIVALDNGQPVPGMVVMVRPAKGGSGMMAIGGSMGDQDRKNVTDAEGRFEVERCPAGRVTLSAYPNDYRGSEFSSIYLPLTVDAGRTTELAPLRAPRKRTKGFDVGGDLGFVLQERSPDADLEQARNIVSVVRPGSAAAKAGLVVGDEIVSVDGQDVVGANGYLYRSLSNVPEGTSIALGLKRGGQVVIQAAKPL